MANPLFEGFDQPQKKDPLMEGFAQSDNPLLQGFGENNSNPLLSGFDNYVPVNNPEPSAWDKVKDTGLSWLDKVVGAIDYAGNTNRSGLESLITKGDYTSGAQAGAMKKKQTTARELRDAATEKVGLGKIRLGEDDGKFQVGDVGDFALDVATDIITDPLSLVSMGVSKLAKGAGALAKAGVTSKALDNYKTFKAVATPTIGGLYGASIPGKDATPLERLEAGLGGAAATVFLGKTLPAFGKKVEELGNATTDWYARWTRPELFQKMNELKNAAGDTPFKDTGYSAINKMATDAMGKAKVISEEIRQKKFAALEKLNDEDFLTTVNIQKQSGNEWVKFRNPLIKQNDKLFPKGSVEWNQGRMLIDQIANKHVEENVLPKLLADQNFNIKNTFLKIKEANREIISNLNKTERFGVDSTEIFNPKIRPKTIEEIRDDLIDHFGSTEALNKALKKDTIHNLYKKKLKTLAYTPTNVAGVTQKGIRGFDYQTASDVVVKSMPKQAKFSVDAIKAHNISMRKKLANRETFSRELENFKTGLYADQFAKDYLNETEATAQKLLMEYKTTLPKQAGARTFEKGLELYDAGLSWIKGNLLHFSTSWVKNNYFGNFLQAYIANGLPNAISVGKQAGNPFNKLGKDIWDLYRGKLQRTYNAPEMADMMKRGVLDGPMYKALMDEDTMKSLFNQDDLKSILTEKGIVGQAIDKWRDVLDKTTGQLGSYVEGAGRATTYKNILEDLKSSPLAKDVSLEKLKDIAAKVSRETFFDYRLSVTPFEQATWKRILPFFAYYRNATPFWVRAAFDPEKVGRVANIKKVTRNIGEEPTPEEKLGMDPWLLNAGARKLGRTATGEKKYQIFPSMPIDDAINLLNVKELPDQFMARLSPLLKTPLEIVTDYDTFTRGPLRPSTTGRKFLFSRGNKDVMIRKAIEAVGLDPDKTLGRIFAVNGVKVDKRGNPYATDDSQLIMSKIYQTLFPTGLIDQVLGSYGKVASGRETSLEMLMNRLTPMQTVKVTPLREAQVRQNRLNNTDELRKKLRERKEQLEKLQERLKNR